MTSQPTTPPAPPAIPARLFTQAQLLDSAGIIAGLDLGQLREDLRVAREYGSTSAPLLYAENAAALFALERLVQTATLLARDYAELLDETQILRLGN